MNRFKAPLLLGAVALLAGSTTAVAQATPYIFAGGGAAIATGDFHTYAKTGWIAQAGLGVDVGAKGLWVEAEGWYGSSKHTDVIGDKTNHLGFFGVAGYSFGPKDAKVHPYLLGGLGWLQHKFVPKTGAKESFNSLGYTAGGGLAFKLGKQAQFFVEGRYMGSTDSKFIPINAGFTLNLKS